MYRDCKKCKHFRGMHPNYNDSFACRLYHYCSWMEYKEKNKPTREYLGLED